MRGGNMHGGKLPGGNWHWPGHPNQVHNRVVFIGGFGFPWWCGWGWGWGPWWGWGWGYPYGDYGYGDPYGYGYPYYGYGNGYGYGPNYGSNYGPNNGPDGYSKGYGQYGDASQSRVAELQRRLQRAGYYHGSIDGVLGSQTRAAIRAYEQEHRSEERRVGKEW